MALTGVAAGDVCKITLKWSLPDVVEAYNTFYWYRSDVVGGIIPFATALGYFEAKLAGMFALIDDSVADVVSTVEISGYTYIFVEGEWVIEAVMGTLASAADGLVVTDMVPHGVAALITYPTALAGTRGRTYLPGFAESAFTASTVTVATVALLEDWADSYLTPLEPGGGYIFVPVVLSYKSGTPVLLVRRVVSEFAAYQRRRGPGRGS